MTNDPFRLDGKVALVTGSATGIGAAIATALAAAGADIACHGKDEPGEATMAAVQKLGRRAAGMAADLADRAAHAELVRRTKAELGRIDILVNNAGLIRRSPAVEYSEEDWDLLIEVNLTSAFRLSQLAGKQMLEQGSGRIVNIASLLSFQGGILVPAYAASKGGIAQLTKALANEWAGRGVNVNAIAPGYITTDNTAALRSDEARSRQILDRIPAGRWGEPSDIAGAALFLCSEASRYVHGHVLVVDGG
ncbi:2-dehydro-3-deoxy-D-gluconate 5-dehydrogenase KduD [Sorangium atrum]|uniref:2-dehydro-3-deoxy-D-gluconate 5-dehydrogenase KduD n=1 Tax=Sorangium atrum TaxID=2995308 RepID=A0ABT5C5B2_9BACT|nr:2-dehydro-3-deoxy-D-gluconate 5-dehydrogenase KduD [Sorangium aterium]MDC0681615.1 2-dehydro-3-deoxy-D-gluconate 5-dehydrogenase KduD [Sorangium aterium]